MSHVGGGEQDFEINLAPIIDCLVVLITFLLASLSYISIQLLDAGVDQGRSNQIQQQTEKALSIHIQKDGSLKVRFGQSPVQTWDGNKEKLLENIQKMKAEFPKINSVSVSAEDTVVYENVVKIVDHLRPVIPFVQLGGF